MSTERDNNGLHPQDVKFINRLASHYAPPPMTSAQRSAFDRALAERLAERSRRAFLRPVTMVVSVCAAALLWFMLLPQNVRWPVERAAQEATISGESAFSDEDINLLTYAYFGQDFDGDDNDEEDESFLPDEYEDLDSAIANLDV
jgi:hypothetical protein